MRTAKGIIHRPENSYHYTCGACQGTGYRHGGRCAYCYNRDYIKVTEQLKTAKGQRYYSLLKTALNIAGKAMSDEFKVLHQEQGKITPVMLAYFAVRFNLNFKATCEWFEECYLIPSGATERIQSTRWTVKEAIEAAHKWNKERSGQDTINLWSVNHDSKP